MNAKRNQLAYQEAAVRNAGIIELVIILYDILARDLHAAIEAMEAGNIETRSARLKHAFLAIQQLEGTLNVDEGGALVVNLARFYSMLRSEMMKAQVRRDPAVLNELIQLLFSVREAWVDLSSRVHSAATTTPNTISAASPDLVGQEARATSSWKA